MSKFIEIEDSLVNVNEIECASMSLDNTSITINFRSGNEVFIKNDNELYISKLYKKIKKVLCDEKTKYWKSIIWSSKVDN